MEKKQIIRANGYDVNICNSFSDMPDLGRELFIVTDNNVKELYLDSFLDVVSKDKGVFVMSPGESYKSFDTVSEIYRAFSAAEVDRKTVVIALGGGVVGDVCGFAAATFMRGVSFVQVPTTLMAMADSSVGGKTAVNFEGLKNLIGAFYQPKLVYINTSCLNTLPKEHISAGMAEIIKYGLIRDEAFFHYLLENSDDMGYLIQKSLEIKAEIVSIDEKEAGIREILNFGHTFGHSIESLLKYEVPHGVCVAIGMRAALSLSAEKGYISFELVQKYSDFCKKHTIPTKLSDIGKILNPLDIYENMRHDKKVRYGSIRLVLLKALGEAFVDESCGKSEIIESISSIL